MDHQDRYENPAVTENKYCCTKFCLTQLDDEFKSKLKSFLSKLSRSEKQIFLFGMISLNEKKHSNSKPVQKSAKNFQYSIKKNGVLWDVCKIAFIELHDTTIHVIRNLCMKMLKKDLVPFDDRGKHDNTSSISEKTKNLIETHFFTILKTPSVSLFRLNLNCYSNDNFCKIYISRLFHRFSNVPRKKLVNQIYYNCGLILIKHMVSILWYIF